MQEKQLFEYAVLRFVPRVEREEFMNVGVILYCPGRQYLNVKSQLDAERLKAFGCPVDLAEIETYLLAFKQVCQGRKDGGVIGALPLASRFRWLTATRSTMLQTSRVHPGFCEDPETALTAIFNEQVLC